MCTSGSMAVMLCQCGPSLLCKETSNIVVDREWCRMQVDPYIHIESVCSFKTLTSPLNLKPKLHISINV